MQSKLCNQISADVLHALTNAAIAQQTLRMTSCVSLEPDQSSKSYPRVHVVLFSWKMPRKRPRSHQAETNLGSAGAFIDTTGETKKSRRKSRRHVEVTDREEKELEALVFGGHPFQPVESYSSDEDYSSEEVSGWRSP